METTTKRSEAQHTQGTWDWAPIPGTPHAARVFVVAGGTSRDIAEVGLDRLADANANAALIASAPAMRATLDATAISLGEIEAALDITLARAEAGQVEDALLGLRNIREAVQALRVNVVEGR